MFKRYVLFSGMQCYAGGGLNDFIMDSDNLEEIAAAIRKISPGDWFHVLDTAYKTICLASDFEALGSANPRNRMADRLWDRLRGIKVTGLWHSGGFLEQDLNAPDAWRIEGTLKGSVGVRMLPCVRDELFPT